jgi:Hemerythrin HHE cation binding domain
MSPIAPEPGSRHRDAILEAHRKLHGLISRIEAALADPHPQFRPSWITALGRSFQTLHPVLEAHFAREEETGLLAPFEGFRPESAQACERLMGEHRTLLRRIDEIQAELASGHTDEDALAALRADARALVADLRRHEKREGDLLSLSLEGGAAAPD